jgi:hypothetical protein
LTIRPPPALSHRRAKRAGEEKRRGQIDVERATPLGERQLAQRSDRIDTGVIDQYVHAVLRVRLTPQFDGVAVRQIELVARGCQNVETVGAERVGQRPTDPP